MPNLYSIRFIHFAPKDSQEGILGYVIAQSSEKIYEFLKTDPEINGLQIYNGFDESEVFEIWDENYNVIGTETFKERMIRFCGEMYDESAEVNDAYYGVTHYGWKLEREIQNEEDISILMDYLNLIVLN